MSEDSEPTSNRSVRVDVEKLRQYLERLGWTNADLARKCDRDVRTIERMFQKGRVAKSTYREIKVAINEALRRERDNEGFLVAETSGRGVKLKLGIIMVEIVLDRDFDEFTDEDRREFIRYLQSVLNLDKPPRVKFRRGSVIASFETTAALAERVKFAVGRGDFEDFSAREVKLIEESVARFDDEEVDFLLPDLSPFSRDTLARHAERPFFKYKSVVDRILGVAFFILVGPVMLALVLLVRLTSRGPGFYRQKRLGKDGRVFEIYKIRTMYAEQENVERPVWTSKHDSRVTPIGAVLRRTHLDELPQLWNVARGDMSLCGPRPERPEIVDAVSHLVDGYDDRSLIKPGITGLAQINLPPDTTIFDTKRKLRLDLHYIATAGWWLDIRIAMVTVLRLFGFKSGWVVRRLGLNRHSFLRDLQDDSDFRAAVSRLYSGKGSTSTSAKPE
ncbi:sugar transferase [Roseiconus lacunae]|uniref:sugar transferase n=1 Tax=Roseiconus lacunae TaxID=2605694 RepID=UPI003085E4E3|nr:sugar transferase [Stieleria sp. HD01]